MALHTHTQGRFNNHTALSLYMILVMRASVIGEMKMGNTVIRVNLLMLIITYIQAMALHIHTKSKFNNL